MTLDNKILSLYCIFLLYGSKNVFGCNDIADLQLKQVCENFLKLFSTAASTQLSNTQSQHDESESEHNSTVPEGFNVNCSDDPELFNSDACGDWTWKKKVKGTYNSDAWKCRDIECLCPYFDGKYDADEEICTLPNGKPLTKAIRKEYRTLSDEERHRFHNALNKLMTDGTYDEISMLHLNASKHHKHATIAVFWNWHRGAVKRYEIEMRKIDPTLAIPYWDSTLDQNLPTSRDSVMWTDDFMGRGDVDGYVISGPAAHWITLRGTPLRRRPVFWGPLFVEDMLKAVFGETQLNMPRQALKNITCKKQLNILFGMHGMPHHYIGGDLEDSPTATNDPMFLLHHGFVDLLWELWKQQKDRTCHIPAVLDDDIDGTYEYALRPRCSWEKPDCGSNYLFCDKSQGQEKPARCASKIKLGGNCEGLDERDEPCNKGICYRNRCIRDSKKNNIIDNTF